MKNFTVFLIVVFLSANFLNAQSLYFPPLTGTMWDSIDPQSIGWCQPRIDSLYNYLQAKNTRSFIIVKDGKIVLEKYFGTYTSDSAFYWASASKSLSSFITGLAQQKGYININSKVSNYIGNGWTSAPQAKEDLITVKHLIEMTSGLDDGPPSPCDNEDTAKSCLIYKADAGTRWAYHTGAYKKSHDVVSASIGQTYNAITTNWIKQKTGMTGSWFQQVYYSNARSMARFGLLNLNKGIWAGDTLMKDSLYFKAMTNTSQSFNLSYGYLWWLNGKSTFMNPGLQLVLNGPLVPNAPSDMYAALGKNDQKIYIVPSTKMVVIRQGNSAEGVTFALSNFDNKLWDYINKLNCVTTSIQKNSLSAEKILVYPNPAKGSLFIKTDLKLKNITLTNLLGEKIQVTVNDGVIDISGYKKGLYFVTFTSFENTSLVKKILVD
ncbi:serine hydrolase [Sphingobacteriaceae bacterium]|nr:serine hydrolase [Sphingobacteriaceae bacterium]